MLIISGFETIKGKDGTIFTKVYLSQELPDGHGAKPFPIPYMVTGDQKFGVGDRYNFTLDTKADGKMYISSLSQSDLDINY